jgi:GT2 family glycosyltransferase
MPLISVIIPVRNRQEYTRHILLQIYDQISKIDADNISVVVVDDGSTDGTEEIIRTQFPTVHLIKGDGSLWWTGAICRGMEYAIENLTPDYIVWLNDDISLSEDFIGQLREICSSPVSRNAVIGGIVRDKTYPDWIVFSGMLQKKLIRSLDYFATEEVIEVDTLNGNITIIPRTLINKIGLPDQVRFRHYGGDFEFVLRAKKSGFKVMLSRCLQATTDYQVADLIRYMPPWLQWYLETDKSKKKEILKGFTNLKAHHNIWHKVNILHCGSKNIPSWKYTIFYLRQYLSWVSVVFTQQVSLKLT